VFVCFLWFPESESDAGRLTWTKRPTVGEGLDATAAACSSCELDHVRAMRMRWSGSQSAAQLFLFSLDFDPQGAPEVVASEMVSAGARRGQVTRPFFSQTFVKRGWLACRLCGWRACAVSIRPWRLALSQQQQQQPLRVLLPSDDEVFFVAVIN
jgi:hypothetical protein